MNVMLYWVNYIYRRTAVVSCIGWVGKLTNSGICEESFILLPNKIIKYAMTSWVSISLVFRELLLGTPNHRIFGDSKYSIFEDRISNHRIMVQYSVTESIRWFDGSNIRKILQDSIIDIRWFDDSVQRIFADSLMIRWFDIRIRAPNHRISGVSRDTDKKTRTLLSRVLVHCWTRCVHGWTADIRWYSNNRIYSNIFGDSVYAHRIFESSNHRIFETSPNIES
jgi:hypothetical protein